MQPRSRWVVVLAGVALLAGAPAVIASLPVDDPGVPVVTLVERIRASGDVPFAGLYESRGGLALPDLGRRDDVVAPFAETTRVQVWYAAPMRWRADTQTIGGEVDWYAQDDGVYRWDSEDRRIDFSTRTGEEPLRFPRAMDLSPAELGRRVVGEARDDELTSIAPQRIAGRIAAGLRITPTSDTTTISAIDVWADADTGVVLRVAIETGGANPILETQFLDFSFGAPSTDTVTFDPAASGVQVRRTETFDVVEQISRAAALIAPATAAVDLPRRGGPTAATFGSDFGIVIVAIAPQRGLGRALNALPPGPRPWGGEASLVETPLVNVELATIRGVDYIIGGTVTVAELDRIAGLVEEGSS